MRPGHNDYRIALSGEIDKSVQAGVWYESYALYNEINGTWYGEFANDSIQAGTRTPQGGDNISTITFDICNNIYYVHGALNVFVKKHSLSRAALYNSLSKKVKKCKHGFKTKERINTTGWRLLQCQ